MQIKTVYWTGKSSTKELEHTNELRSYLAELENGNAETIVIILGPDEAIVVDGGRDRYYIHGRDKHGEWHYEDTSIAEKDEEVEVAPDSWFRRQNLVDANKAEDIIVKLVLGTPVTDVESIVRL